MENNKENGLDIKHFELAKKLSSNIIKEMDKAGLTTENIPEVLGDICKTLILSGASINEKGALWAVQQFTGIAAEATTYMLAIVAEEVKAQMTIH